MEVLIATTNKGKQREFEAILHGLPVDVLTPLDLGLTAEIEEYGESFEANASLKAVGWAKKANLICVADDSGLCVPALDDGPGILSARWGLIHHRVTADADPETIDVANRHLVIDQLHGQEDRSAYYVCVAALAWPDGRIKTARGEWHGHLIEEERGDQGFGYDPIFVPEGYEITAAQMHPYEKNQVSHRGKALRTLRPYLEGLVSTPA